MIRYILLFGLLSCFGYVGIGLGRFYTKKQLLYENLIDFCNLLLSEISFLKNDLITICRRQEKAVGGEFGKLLNTFTNKLISVEFDANLSFENFLKRLPMEKSEIVSLQNFFDSLGKTGVDEQINLVRYHLSVFEANYQKARENAQKYAPLFKKMGWIVGLLVCIVLI